MIIEVSNGEIVDKYTILKLKLKNSFPASLKYFNIHEEYTILKQAVGELNVTDNLINDLYEINKTLWDIEDKIRIKEQNKQFDQEFIELARSVYITNDKRFLAKNLINNLTKSNLKEEKILPNYEK